MNDDDDKDGWMIDDRKPKQVGEKIEMSIPPKDEILLRAKTKFTIDTKPNKRITLKPLHNTIRKETGDGRIYLFAKILSIDDII